VPRDALKVLIGAEESQSVPDAKLRNQRVDCPDLNSRSTTGVSQRRSLDVVISVRIQKRHGGKPLENLSACLGPSETLQQLLEHESSREDGLAGAKGVGERHDLGDRRGRIPTQCQ
jgi:hypothetical protein